MQLSPWLLLFVLSSAIASFAQVLLKKGAAIDHGSFLREYLNPHVIIGYGLMFAGMLLGVIAYRHVEYKNGSVMESFAFLMVMILSRIFFGEKITKRKVFGNVMILVGIAVFYLL